MSHHGTMLFFRFSESLPPTLSCPTGTGDIPAEGLATFELLKVTGMLLNLGSVQ